MRLTERDGEELHALIAGRGWLIFLELIEEMYGNEQIVNDLYTKANANMDLTDLGRHTAVVLSTRKAIDNILAIPQTAIDQIEGERK
jgi:hypothetical protein